jgi:hypothetical protein
MRIIDKKENSKSNMDIVDMPIIGNLLHKDKSFAGGRPPIPALLMRGGSRPKTVNTASASANAHITSLYSTAFSSHKNSVGYVAHGRK